ncbi:hypothetical protein IEQ34_008294 [Dendrobium chrysotoxum]|uniref:Uncharacterized protein n=1 Tax=Dendrobium chrysotoxum TaxID=161865 RepID=A0AAV7H725_DENCH|nr:hypothetical protein IEQ34_008294 [Dendrobium chrysotoxum]
MSGSTGEHSFVDILTSLPYWVIHSINIPSIFIVVWLFVRMEVQSVSTTVQLTTNSEKEISFFKEKATSYLLGCFCPWAKLIDSSPDKVRKHTLDFFFAKRQVIEFVQFQLRMEDGSKVRNEKRR